MRNECSIIGDILPLYLEGMTSDVTVSFVEEHLQSCEDCRSKLNAMKAGGNIPETGDSDLGFMVFMKRWNHKLRLLYWIISTLMLVIAVIAEIGAVTARGSGFLDVSNIARGIFCVISITCVIASALLWKTENPRIKTLKTILAIAAIVIIIAITIAAPYFRSPSVEIMRDY